MPSTWTFLGGINQLLYRERKKADLAARPLIVKLCGGHSSIRQAPYHIMPPMPPMPPMSGMPPPASFFGSFGDHGFRGDQQASNRSCVLQGRADNLDRIDDAHGDHVAIFAGLGVVAEVVVRCFSRILPTTIEASSPALFSDLANRRLQRAANDVDAGCPGRRWRP